MREWNPHGIAVIFPGVVPVTHAPKFPPSAAALSPKPRRVVRPGHGAGDND